MIDRLQGKSSFTDTAIALFYGSKLAGSQYNNNATVLALV